MAGRRERTDLVLVIAGSRDGVSAFLQRLRTECVDVDSRGRRCRERQATVLCRRERRGLLFTGWAEKVYETATGLDEALEELQLLHVGVGAARFEEAVPC